MKKFFSNAMLIGSVAIAGLFTSCSKDDDNNTTTNPTLATKEYKLYNLSSGSSVEAGSVLFSQLADSTVSAKITLNAGYHQSGSTYTANIISSIAVGDLLYANLAGVDGGTGTSTTVPVRNAANNATLKYSQIIALIGYRVRIMNGSIVQATGTIQ